MERRLSPKSCKAGALPQAARTEYPGTPLRATRYRFGCNRESIVNNLIYLVGLVVVVAFIASFVLGHV
jgi:hypothetical protein